MKKNYHSISKVTNQLRENDSIVTWYNDYYEESFHTKHRTLPIIGVVATRNHIGEKFCKLTYYQKPPTENPIAEELLPMSMTADEMYTYILEKLFSDYWLEQAEYFVSDRSLFIDTPLVSLYLYDQKSRIRHSFQVRGDEMIPPQLTPSGEVLSTKTIFDLAISTEYLSPYEWYDLQFGHDNDDLTFTFEKSRIGESLFIMPRDSDWGLVLGGMQSASNEYDIQFLPKGRGFSFRITNPNYQRIWFKLGWIKLTNHKREDCIEALRKWIG